MGKLGTLTIGQAPRADITPILDVVLTAGLPRVHAGILDGLSRGEIEEDFAAVPGKPVLITKLLDGSSVIIDRARTEAAAQRKLHALEAEGCTTILMLCTGHFETLRTRQARFLEPDRILPPTVAALTHGAQLGIVVPLAEQIASEAAKWEPLTLPPICAAASPYQGDLAAVTQAAEDLRARGAGILLMDCMGFVEAHRRAAAAAGLPVILSNSLISKLASELV
ncbi:AroM family protein [Bosea sp. (in: a-proteobacteria)]|uniref:AroM family protein n=1 Tax=Bosea sp. (in: a-proteobacteria) TaxID=1871050 RepID=UPI003342DEA0